MGVDKNLSDAVFNRDTETVRKLLNDPDVDINNHLGRESATPLILATLNGHLEMVKLLVDAGADIDAQGDGETTALFSASFDGYEEIVKYLLLKSKNVKYTVNFTNDVDDTPLMAAIMHKYSDIAILLINAGANVNTKHPRGFTPLLMAVNKSQVDVIHSLIDKNANIRDKDDKGLTALHYAVIRNLPDVVKLLIKSGINPNIKDNTGSIPIFYCDRNGPLEIFEFLLSISNLNSVNNQGLNLLHIIAFKGNYDMMKLLMKFDIYLDSQTNTGNTALLIVDKFMSNDIDEENTDKIIKLLIRYGADPTFLNNQSEHLYQHDKNKYNDLLWYAKKSMAYRIYLRTIKISIIVEKMSKFLGYNDYINIIEEYFPKWHIFLSQRQLNDIIFMAIEKYNTDPESILESIKEYREKENMNLGNAGLRPLLDVRGNMMEFEPVEQWME